MVERRILPAYLACLQLGVREALRSRADVTSRMLVYGVLLTVFSTIYRIMPLEQFGVPGLTAEKLLWYFAITEVVIVSGQGIRREFGKQIAAGELTALMQRPGNMLGLVMVKLLGMFGSYAVLALVLAFVALPLVGNAPMPMPLMQLPLLIMAIVFAGIISLLLGYLVSLLEVLGPYSQPIDWIASKFIMALGGLFLPVSLFPGWAEKLAWLTPFPSILYTPASLMLGADTAAMAERMAMQLFWVGVLLGAVLLLESRLLRRVLIKGD